MNELITIIINVYNGEKYIKKCLESVINQTYKNLEILIINDGSTDNTLSICKTIKDKRIKIISTTNLGLSLSRNKGIDNAKGEYLYFVDVDDFIEIDTIEYLYKLIKKYKSSIALCESIDIYSDKKIIKKNDEIIKIFNSEEMLKINLLSQINHSTTTWNKLYKKDIFAGIRFEDRIVNDRAVTYKLYIKANKIVYSNQIKYYYYRNPDSISMKKRSDYGRLKDMYDVSIERHNNIKMLYPNMIENDIGLLLNIADLYIRKNDKFSYYLKSKNAIKIYKKIFKFKMLKYNMRKNERKKLLLFRLNPYLYKKIINLFLKLKYSNNINKESF